MCRRTSFALSQIRYFRSYSRTSLSRLSLEFCLVHLVCLDGIVGDHIERLEVESAGSEDNPARLTAQGGDAAAHQLQQNMLILVLQPTGIELLILLMRLRVHSHQALFKEGCLDIFLPSRIEDYGGVHGAVHAEDHE